MVSRSVSWSRKIFTWRNLANEWNRKVQKSAYHAAFGQFFFDFLPLSETQTYCFASSLILDTAPWEKCTVFVNTTFIWKMSWNHKSCCHIWKVWKIIKSLKTINECRYFFYVSKRDIRTFIIHLYSSLPNKQRGAKHSVGFWT